MSPVEKYLRALGRMLRDSGKQDEGRIERRLTVLLHREEALEEFCDN